MSTHLVSKPFGNLFKYSDDFFKPWNDWFDVPTPWFNTLTTPAANIEEQADKYLINLAIPGMNKSDFKVKIEGNLLTISCEKKEDKEVKENNFTRREYNYASFKRSFTIPEDAKFDGIDANYKDGVLELMLPKNKELAKSKQVKEISIK